MELLGSRQKLSLQYLGVVHLLRNAHIANFLPRMGRQRTFNLLALSVPWRQTFAPLPILAVRN